jgi:hypothetical protein
MASYPTVPDYMTLAQQQAQYNSGLAQQQSQLNNPNQYNPFGSRTTTYNPDGTSSVNTTLNPQQQALFNGSTNISQGIQNYANGMIGGLNYNNVPGMPSASQSDLNATRDAVYGQQTQYLDPQFQQGQSDLDSQLANKGIMEGSDAWNRAQNNFALQKQAAYGDARDRAIQAGGAEQSRLFNLGMSARQEGVNENNALFAGNLNGLNAVKGAGSYTMPTFQGTTATNIGNVDWLNAANQAYQGQLGQANAQNASNANLYNGLFSLGNTALQNPSAVKGVWDWATSGGG